MVAAALRARAADAAEPPRHAAACAAPWGGACATLPHCTDAQSCPDVTPRRLEPLRRVAELCRALLAVAWLACAVPHLASAPHRRNPCAPRFSCVLLTQLLIACCAARATAPAIAVGGVSSGALRWGDHAWRPGALHVAAALLFAAAPAAAQTSPPPPPSPPPPQCATTVTLAPGGLNITTGTALVLGQMADARSVNITSAQMAGQWVTTTTNAPFVQTTPANTAASASWLAWAMDGSTKMVSINVFVTNNVGYICACPRNRFRALYARADLRAMSIPPPQTPRRRATALEPAHRRR
jgi:hypothetical protein